MKSPKEPPKSIDEYIAGFPEDVQAILQKIRSTIKGAAPDAEEGGVAHDFNNLLTAIIGYVDLLIGDLDPGDPKGSDLSGIRRCAERAAQLTRQLLAFGRRTARTGSGHGNEWKSMGRFPEWRPFYGLNRHF